MISLVLERYSETYIEQFGFCQSTNVRGVGLIRRQAGERDQPPRLVVAALVRHKVAQQMPTQAGDDAGPVFSVGDELVFLERVDFVADETGDGHEGSSCW